MDKKLTARRLRKRHNRHASGEKNWGEHTKPDLRTPERIQAVRQARRDAKAKRKAAV